MILIVTNSEDKTVDYISSKIKYPFFRFDTDKFISNYDYVFTSGCFSLANEINKTKVDSKDLVGILYRRPVNPYVNIDSNELLSQELRIEARFIYEYSLNNIQTKWMSHPNNVRIAEDKVLQLKIANAVGLKTPETIITNNSTELLKFMKREKEYCIKPVYLGAFESEGNNYVPYNTKISDSDDLELIRNFPAIIQEYIIKEYELRVIIVGDDVFSIKIESQLNNETKEDWRVNNCSSVNYSVIDLPLSVIEKCKNMLRELKLSFSSMDIIYSSDGNYYFVTTQP